MVLRQCADSFLQLGRRKEPSPFLFSFAPVAPPQISFPSPSFLPQKRAKRIRGKGGTGGFDKAATYVYGRAEKERQQSRRRFFSQRKAKLLRICGFCGQRDKGFFGEAFAFFLCLLQIFVLAENE